MNQGAPGNTLCGEEVEELERAAALIAGMMQHPGLCAPTLLWAVQPSHGFSSDAVAASRDGVD